MGMSNSKFKECLTDFKDRVGALKTVDFGNIKDVDELVSLYGKISFYIVDSKSVPDSVKKFVIAEDGDNLPDEYADVLAVKELYEVIKTSAKESISKFISDKNYDKAVEVLSKALRISIKNIDILEYAEQILRENGLFDELVDLYKLEFLYTTDPLCFEKAGDVYYEKEDYSLAVDSYLSCAEISDDYLQIYEKLADVFGKINDETSRLACLEQIKRIKDGL